jgi:Family of unknown function (DUF6338)
VEALKEFSFWAVVAFVLPGFFLVQARCFGARARIAPITKESVTSFVIATVIYNLVLWSFGIALQSQSSISSLEPVVLLKTYMVLPCLIGFVFGLAEHHAIFQQLLSKFGINAPLPFDNVWIEKFSKQPFGTYMIVTLKDGTFYRTMVTRDSRFGSKGDDRHLSWSDILWRRVGAVGSPTRRVCAG